MLPNMLYYPPFSLENHTCDLLERRTRTRNISQAFSLQMAGMLLMVNVTTNVTEPLVRRLLIALPNHQFSLRPLSSKP
jgi:hypothetical protein